MKISHECPISLLEESREFNDYDYALVHLFEENEDYFEFFKESISLGRKVILDNSIFELEKAFNPERFAYWINRLQPTEYIIPDVLESCQGTMSQARQWNKHYGLLPGEKIGVVQGKNLKEIIHCYEVLDREINVDKIAISFDYSYYQKICPHPNKWYSWAIGRVTLITQLLERGIINRAKPHHLLGCGVPMEGMFYKDNVFDFIESIDTSNPVVHAIYGDVYREGWGLSHKQSQKLFTMLQTQRCEIDTKLLNHNLETFKQLWK